MIFFFLLFLFVADVHAEVYHLQGNFGVFSSTGFPTPYANNLNDSWIITVPKGYRVKTYFTYFDLEDSLDVIPCALDYVEVLDDVANSTNSLGRFCGNNALYSDDAPTLFDQQFRSSGNTIRIKMVSDYSNEGVGLTPPRGFRAIFVKEDRNECVELRKAALLADEPENVGLCDHFCNNYPGGYFCSCRTGFKLHADGFTCVGDCQSVQITNPQGAGTIQSPGFPTSYPRKTECTWKIQTGPGGNIALTFDTNFGIEQHTSGTCPYDWLEITDSSGRVGTFCGHTAPENGATYKSTTNWVKIVFHTDSVTEDVGFQLTYEAHEIRCVVPPPPKHGRMTSPARSTSDGPQYVSYSSVIRFECNFGFRLIGSAKLVCLKDGSLSDFVPICEVF